jgi:heterotetrameric sarcosine oxidase gamma subunit
MAQRLLDTDLTATHFDPSAGSAALPDRCEIVVIGAGIVGASVAYHLAGLGHEVLVVERHAIASGTSWHAAGLVVRGRGAHVLTDLACASIDLYRELQASTGVDVNLEQPGSLTLARTPGRLDELRSSAMIARHHGIPAEIVAPSRVAELCPLASPDGLVGALHQPHDGHVNPGLTAQALATAAHARGVRFREGRTVTGFGVVDGRVRSVTTTDATGEPHTIECDRVVLAAGLWTRDLAALAGAAVPLWPAAHVHVQTADLGELADPSDPTGDGGSMPVLRDLDGYFYARQLNRRLLIGAFEPDGQPLDPRSLAADFAFGEFQPDWDHFAPVRRLAEERLPVLRDVTWARFLNAPESFTPDANFCLGETAEVAGLFVAAGFNSQGIIYAGGAGRALAEWIHEGAPTIDAAALDVRRFSPQQSTRRYLHERTAEGLGRLYAMHWPFLQPRTARGVRRTPLHDRLADAGACFGEANGWERANWFAPPGEVPEYRYSYQRQNWFEHSAAEHRAAREAVAVFDLSTFTKVEVAGPGALTVLQQVCTQDLDVAIGRAVYTLMLNRRGGIELDGTVTRLAADRFLVVTPTVSHTITMSLLRNAARGTAAAVFDATSGLATIAVMGPHSRALLQRLSPDDLSNEVFPWGTARYVEIGRLSMLCIRISFVGELGYELYPTADGAVDVDDAVMEAGADLGVRRAGYHALDSLRVEKGYRHLGHDIGPIDDPYMVGLGFTVAHDKPGGFVGRDAIDPARPRTHRQVYVRLDDPEPLLLHGESILADGRIVGRMTSGAYGHTIGAACGLGIVSSDVVGSDAVAADAVGAGGIEVDCAGQRVPATLSLRPFHDPTGARLRS